MALKLGTLNKARPAFGTGSGSENVAVMIAEIHLADKTKKSINVAEDYAVAYLLEDAFGKKAEFKPRDPALKEEDDTEYGSPLTSVKIKMRDRKLTGEHAPMEIFDLQPGKRKGAALPMGQYPTVLLENAYLDTRADVVLAGWLTVAQRDFSNPLERCLTNVIVSVDSERYDMKENERVYRQNRFVVMADEAQTFNSLESFKAAAASFLSENPDAAGGQPVVTIRIIDNDSVVNSAKVAEIATATIYQGWDAATSTRMSPEASVDRWLANPDNADWVSYIEASGGETGYTFEVIPSFRYNTGVQSLPSKKGKGIDDAENFRVPVEQRENGGAKLAKNNGDGFVMTSGYAAGSMIVKRVNAEDAPWFATKTFRKNRFGSIYMKDEVVTPNLPEDVRKAFETAAAGRGQAAKETMNKNRTGSADAAPHADDEIPFGEPDHSGGLTPQ